jgi:hypothetical protein
MMCVPTRVKPKLEWRPQEVRDDRNVKHLLRKAAGSRWSQPKREAIYVSTSKAIGVGFPSP